MDLILYHKSQDLIPTGGVGLGIKAMADMKFGVKYDGDCGSRSTKKSTRRVVRVEGKDQRPKTQESSYPKYLVQSTRSTRSFSYLSNFIFPY